MTATLLWDDGDDGFYEFFTKFSFVMMNSNKKSDIIYMEACGGCKVCYVIQPVHPRVSFDTIFERWKNDFQFNP